MNWSNLVATETSFFIFTDGLHSMESSYKADFKQPMQPMASQRSISSVSSGRSKSSSKSMGRYRRSEGGVDETLFAVPKTERSASASRAELIRKAPSKVEMDSIVLNASDVDRIRRAAAPILGTGAEDERLRQEREEAQAKAKERKQRMLAMEAQRKAKQEKSDLDLEDEDRNASINSNAQHVYDETLDPVKHMNSQVHHLHVFQFRLFDDFLLIVR
jgi:hypothetical protein